MRATLVLIAFLCLVSAEDEDTSYSYQKFRGPVSGQIHEVLVPGYYQNEQYTTVDYVAKPDYLYSYGVQDPVNGNSQIHKETRDGDTVAGEYSVLQPDGMLRIVKYTADGTNGFKATIQYIKV